MTDGPARALRCVGLIYVLTGVVIVATSPGWMHDPVGDHLLIFAATVLWCSCVIWLLSTVGKRRYPPDSSGTGDRE